MLAVNCTRVGANEKDRQKQGIAGEEMGETEEPCGGLAKLDVLHVLNVCVQCAILSRCISQFGTHCCGTVKIQENSK